MQKWEYLSCRIPASEPFGLTKIGDEGWELVTVRRIWHEDEFIFKRPKQSATVEQAKPITKRDALRKASVAA